MTPPQPIPLAPGSNRSICRCWLAGFEDWFGRANVSDWSAEECRAERATHEARQIEAVRVRPGGVARGLIDVIRVLGDHQTRTHRDT
jgi:hypothetical protein